LTVDGKFDGTLKTLVRPLKPPPTVTKLPLITLSQRLPAYNKQVIPLRCSRINKKDVLIFMTFFCGDAPILPQAAHAPNPCNYTEYIFIFRLSPHFSAVFHLKYWFLNQNMSKTSSI
jgi:hypothetical protein